MKAEPNFVRWIKIGRDYLVLGFSGNLAAYLMMMVLWLWLNVDVGTPAERLLQVVGSISGLGIVAGAVILSWYLFLASRPVPDQHKELITVGVPWFLVSLGTMIGVLLYLGSFDVRNPLQLPWVLLQLFYVSVMLLGIITTDDLYVTLAKARSSPPPDTTAIQHIGVD